MCKFNKKEDKDEICIFVGFYNDKKMEVNNKESVLYVDLILTFEELNAFFDGKEIDLASMKKDKYKNVSFSDKVFSRSGELSIAVKQDLDEKLSNCELKEQFTSVLD